MNLLNDNAVIGGHRIACGVHGSGEPIVLLHGTPSHSFIWRKVVPRLLDAGRRVYLFDLLGFGASERPRAPEVDTSVAAQDAILTGLMSHWGLGSAHIVAHDIGGAIGLRFGIFHPDMTRSLTVIDAVSYDSWPSKTWRKIIAEGLDPLMLASRAEHQDRFTTQLKMTVHDKTIMEGEVLEAYLGAISGPIGQPSFFQHQVRHYDSIHTEEIEDRLRELGRLPIQILWGGSDEWQPTSYAERLARDIPGSKLHIVPQAGHFLMEDQPDRTADLILEFVNA